MSLSETQLPAYGSHNVFISQMVVTGKFSSNTACWLVDYRLLAPAEQGSSLTDNTEHPLGIMPHQVRGFIAHYAQLVVTGHAFDKCTACSATVCYPSLWLL